MINLTFFTIPQTFNTQYDLMWWNAVKSWTLLKPKPDIFLLGNAPSLASIANDLSLYHIPNLDQNSSINEIAKWLDKLTNNRIIVYINPNVILTEGFTETIQDIYNNQDNFLLTGQYRVIQAKGSININNNQWQQLLRTMAYKQTMPQLQNIYLVFTKQLLKQLFAPDPNVEYSWKKQLSYAALRKSYPIIDGSNIITPFLQTSKKRDQIRTQQLSERFCIQPFNRLETRHNGEVFTCSMNWLSTPIGNINHDTPENIWNSKIAQKIRQSILDGSFSYCSQSKCPKIINKTLPFKKDIRSKFERAIIDQHITVMPIKPQEIKLNHERSSKPADTVILPLLKDAKLVEITGAGDAFGSEHFRYIMKQINAQAFPQLKIDLFTNGVLFDEKSWHQLELQGLCRRAVISVDATLEKTYNILRKGGDFKRLLQNLEFISRLRQSGELSRVVLVFTVQKENFLQIPDLIRLVKKFNFNQAFFQMITPWNKSIEEYEDKNVGLSKHPLHQDFLQILRDPLLQYKVVSLGTMKPFYDQALQSTFDNIEESIKTS